MFHTKYERWIVGCSWLLYCYILGCDQATVFIVCMYVGHQMCFLPMQTCQSNQNMVIPNFFMEQKSILRQPRCVELNYLAFDVVFINKFNPFFLQSFQWLCLVMLALAVTIYARIPFGQSTRYTVEEKAWPVTCKLESIVKPVSLFNFHSIVFPFLQFIQCSQKKFLQSFSAFLRNNSTIVSLILCGFSTISLIHTTTPKQLKHRPKLYGK